ncbi:hypothetical protein VP01_1213g4 [Puccinia sorghi]|uniref:Uncharacterized protein n=1 Tax=Puccinia sorghi TaxID=27349 RepID=A0A0L6VQE9_9BASI|nr:hypothetical protein VP01_1213g4 [Puccinia sorghi]
MVNRQPAKHEIINSQQLVQKLLNFVYKRGSTLSCFLGFTHSAIESFTHLIISSSNQINHSPSQPHFTRIHGVLDALTSCGNYSHHTINMYEHLTENMAPLEGLRAFFSNHEALHMLHSNLVTPHGPLKYLKTLVSLDYSPDSSAQVFLSLDYNHPFSSTLTLSTSAYSHFDLQVLNNPVTLQKLLVVVFLAKTPNQVTVFSKPVIVFYKPVSLFTYNIPSDYFILIFYLKGNLLNLNSLLRLRAQTCENNHFVSSIEPGMDGWCGLLVWRLILWDCKCDNVNLKSRIFIKDNKYNFPLESLNYWYEGGDMLLHDLNIGEGLSNGTKIIQAVSQKVL